MRLEGFKKAGQEPIGVGESKEVFVNPIDSEMVISVIKEKEGLEKDSRNK